MGRLADLGRTYEDGNSKKIKRKAKEDKDNAFIAKLPRLTELRFFSKAGVRHMPSTSVKSCENTISNITDDKGGQSVISDLKRKKLKACTFNMNSSVKSCLDTSEKASLKLKHSAMISNNSSNSETSETNVIKTSASKEEFLNTNKNNYPESQCLNIDIDKTSELEPITEHENLNVITKSGLSDKLESSESNLENHTDNDDDGFYRDYITQNLKHVFESESENESDDEYSSNDNKCMFNPFLTNDLDNACIIPEVDRQLYSNDLGDWPNPYPDRHRDYWIAKGSSECQHSDSDFIASKRYSESDDCYRYCKQKMFIQVHSKTKQKNARTWLCYSESKGSLFCFICKLMMPTGYSTKFTEIGFVDWQHACSLLNKHEQSQSHKDAFISLLTRK